MTDAELFAKSVLLLVQAVEGSGENDLRRINGEAPAYRDGTGLGYPYTREIEEELARRKAQCRSLDQLAPVAANEFQESEYQRIHHEEYGDGFDNPRTYSVGYRECLKRGFLAGFSWATQNIEVKK